MLEALATLLAFQLLGEAVTHLVGWPVPGPVVGMALLFLAWPMLPRIRYTPPLELPPPATTWRSTAVCALARPVSSRPPRARPNPGRCRRSNPPARLTAHAARAFTGSSGYRNAPP